MNQMNLASSPLRLTDPVRASDPAAWGESAAFDALVTHARDASKSCPLLDGSREAAAAALLAQLRRTAPEGVDLARYLPTLNAEELFLASAVAAGSHKAAATLRSSYQATVDRALRASRLDEASAADVAQRIWERMLCGGPDGLPAIATYSGRGALGAWLHVSVVREAHLEQSQRARHAGEGSGAALETELGTVGDSELEYMKTLYADRFRSAFREALSMLPVRDRNLLRYTYVDGLTADRVGELYGVHRVSVARWLARAREALAHETRRILSRDLNLEGGESESVLRLIESRLDMSLSALAADA